MPVIPAVCILIPMNETEQIEILMKLELVVLICKTDYESEKDLRIVLSGIEILTNEILEILNI